MTMRSCARNDAVADGTVRRWDVREPGPGRGADEQARSLLVEQRSERTGRSGTRVAVNSVVVDPMRPHIFATGGSDPLGELRTSVCV